jgi:ketol-acid reductoisomerase
MLEAQVAMATIIDEADIDPSPILSRKIGIIGFGSQGHAHALNLRDSHVQVRIALLPRSAGIDRANELEFEVTDSRSLSAWADVLVFAVPDVAMKSVFSDLDLRAGQTLVFLHGFAIHFGFVTPPTDVDVVLVSPAGPGPGLRAEFLAGGGFASLYAVAQDATGHAKETALAYARCVGCAKAGVIESTFQEETETDLFGEQAVLCGGLPELIKAGFKTLVEAGYQPEVAYFECVHQVKLITDLIYEGGLTWMRQSISGTAEWGGFNAGPAVISKQAESGMKSVLERIRNGEFAREWMAQYEAGLPDLQQRRQQEASLTIEAVGKALRARMPFINDK